MAGKTLKTSVKSTATRKTDKLATVKGSAITPKDKYLKSNRNMKKEVNNVSSVETKSVSAKSASKSKAASEVKTKTAPVKKSAAKTKTTAKPADKPDKSAAASLTKKTPKKSISKADVSQKVEDKKAVKSKTTLKSEKQNSDNTVVKKTAKPAKPVQTQTAKKPLKKNDTVKMASPKKSENVSKNADVDNNTIKNLEEFDQDQEQISKPKAKRATKFMTKGNAAIIAQLRQQLIQRRNEILSFYWGDLGSSNVSSQASGDSADAAMDSVHSEMRSQLAEKESQELTDINNALHKMETGEYGLCEECGMPIAIERLEAIPDAELCLKCQEELEEDGDYDNYSYNRYD